MNGLNNYGNVQWQHYQPIVDAIQEGEILKGMELYRKYEKDLSNLPKDQRLIVKKNLVRIINESGRRLHLSFAGSPEGQLYQWERVYNTEGGLNFILASYELAAKVTAKQPLTK